MAIGKPLLVNQRREVEQPVLSAQTQQLSSNVPAQKLAMLDYSIGQANTKASFAVTDELRGLVDAGIQAKLYMDNTQRDHKRLSLMNDWQQSNLDYQADFALARTPEQQATVISNYQNETQSRTDSFIKSQGNGIKAQAQLADLRSTANTQFSKFSVTQQNNLFKQTSSMYETDTATIAQSVAEDVNIDPVVAFKKIADNYADMVGIGALTAPAAAYQQGLLQDKMITARSGLFARNYAKDVLAEGRELPSDKEFKTQINGVMGLELSERRLKLASRSFTDTYYKELKAFNSQVAAEDAHNKEAISEDLAVFESKLNAEILDKTVTEENKQALYEDSKQYDSVIDGYSAGVLQKLNAVHYGTATQSQVDHFTVGQGGLDLQAVLQSGGVDYYDLKAVEYAMRNAPGEYAGMNENTILGIVRHYRNENATLVTQFSKRAPLLLKTNMVAAMQNNQIFLQSEEAGMSPEFWDAIKKTTALNWESVFSQDLEYGEAFARVQGVLAQAATQGTGPYNKDEIGDDIAARTVALNSFIQQTIATEFGAATAQKRGKVQEAKDQKAEAESQDSAAQTSGSFRFGGKTAKKKPYIGAEETASKNLQDTLSTQGAEKYKAIKERIQTDLKRMAYDSQPDWVKAVDQAIPNFEIKIGTPKFKDVATAIMGSANTAYLTGLKNKQLKKEIEGIITRPLTKDELAGKSPLINEMASTVIKREESSSIGRFVRDLVSSTPSDSAKILENLGYEFKQKALEGLQRGMETEQPQPLAPPVVPDVSQASPLVDTGEQAQVVPEILEPSMVQQVATAVAPFADAVFGGSTVSAEPTQFQDLSPELQAEAQSVQYVTSEDSTSSIMRNNPFNVESSKNKWQGLVESDSSRFMATDTPLNGLRAGYINFLAKLSRGETVSQMVETLSPKSDKNPTASMVKVVSAMADVSPDATLEVSMDNFEEIKQLGLGLLRFEAPGHTYPDSLIDEAVKLAIEQKSGKSPQAVPDKSKMYPPPKNFKREKELKPIVEKTGNFFDSIGDAMRTGLTEAIPDNLRFFASYLHDEYRGLQGRSTDKPVITENQLSSGVQSILKTAALKAHAEGRDYVTYTDYPDSSVGLSIPAIVASKGAKNQEEYAEAKKRYPKGWKGKARLLLDSTDDAIAAATTIGQFSFKIENGELVLFDTYDFSKYGGAKNSAYAEVRKSVETAKDGVAYQIKANLGKFV